MGKIIRRFQTQSGLAGTVLALLALATSFLIPVLSDLKNQPIIVLNPLFWVSLVFVVVALLIAYYVFIRKPHDEIPSIKDSAKCCDSIWGMWWSGDRQYKVMKNPAYITHYKMILLPDIKAETFTQMMKKAGAKPLKVVSQIKRITKLATTSNIEVRWYAMIQNHALTLYDPQDIRGYVIKQDLGVGTRREFRKLSMFRIDEQEESPKVQQYRQEFNNVWNHANTRVPKKEEYE